MPRGMPRPSNQIPLSSPASLLPRTECIGTFLSVVKEVNPICVCSDDAPGADGRCQAIGCWVQGFVVVWNASGNAQAIETDTAVIPCFSPPSYGMHWNVPQVLVSLGPGGYLKRLYQHYSSPRPRPTHRQCSS